MSELTAKENIKTADTVKRITATAKRVCFGLPVASAFDT